MTIWIDVLGNGPFYLAAIYAISRGRDWIRVPALVWSGTIVRMAREHPFTGPLPAGPVPQ